MREFWKRKKIKIFSYSLGLFTPVCRMRVMKADEGIPFYQHLNQNIRNYSSSWAMWKKLKKKIRSLFVFNNTNKEPTALY